MFPEANSIDLIPPDRVQWVVPVSHGAAVVWLDNFTAWWWSGLTREEDHIELLNLVKGPIPAEPCVRPSPFSSSLDAKEGQTEPLEEEEPDEIGREPLHCLWHIYISTCCAQPHLSLAKSLAENSRGNERRRGENRRHRAPVRTLRISRTKVFRRLKIWYCKILNNINVFQRAAKSAVWNSSDVH